MRDNDLLIETPNSNAGFYPDLSVHCIERQKGTAITAKAPALILEVLSPTTRNYDLTTKRKEYFFIPTLRHYLLLDSETVSVMLYSRQDSQPWPREPQYFSSLDARIHIPDLDINLEMKELYDGTDLLT